MSKKQMFIFLASIILCLTFVLGFHGPAFASEVNGIIQSSQEANVTNNDSNYQQYVNSLPKLNQINQPHNENQRLLPDIVLIGSLMGAIFMFATAISFKP